MEASSKIIASTFDSRPSIGNHEMHGCAGRFCSRWRKMRAIINSEMSTTDSTPIRRAKSKGGNPETDDFNRLSKWKKLVVDFQLLL
jgi:hypothetical protein